MTRIRSRSIVGALAVGLFLAACGGYVIERIAIG
jgi:hypothetical protein